MGSSIKIKPRQIFTQRPIMWLMIVGIPKIKFWFRAFKCSMLRTFMWISRVRCFATFEYLWFFCIVTRFLINPVAPSWLFSVWTITWILFNIWATFYHLDKYLGWTCTTLAHGRYDDFLVLPIHSFLYIYAMSNVRHRVKYTSFETYTRLSLNKISISGTDRSFLKCNV